MKPKINFKGASHNKQWYCCKKWRETYLNLNLYATMFLQHFYFKTTDSTEQIRTETEKCSNKLLDHQIINWGE